MSVELKASVRDRVGKGAARELRRNGLVPAVIYGDKKAPLAISVSYKDTFRKIHDGGFLSHVIEIDVDGEKHRVIPKDYQLEPVRDFLVHVDFLRIGKNTTLTVEVPVNFINEEKSPGLKKGGVLNIVRHAVEVSCPAESIPENLVVDLAGVEVGDSIHISAVTLPKGVTPTITDRDFTIATIAAPSALRSSEGGASDEEAETGEGEE
ncbi:50S ribosomal protein L25/general stress protein Ctc [Pelagibacterium lentulum]|uniref:Large ribosomal subunit protein bL25 n=1 Tax=Pelagibacterium lentulum TaxID=2029865 RepID=A0A916RCM7_9HYPH|nr:50S ribosomal protein L25/general stress protein Ctc [Pelagibacterium lentulum]GGA45127.1 50S ribosomal protein L25 [Pelagibacterium lentulum]